MLKNMQNIQKYFNLFEGARLILSLLHLISVKKLGLAYTVSSSDVLLIVD